MRKLAWCVFFFTLLPLCPADILTVDDDGPANFNTIQAAINASNNGDIIVVYPGIYKGNGNRDIDFLGKAITLRSTDPANPNIVASTVIDCGGTEIEPHRGFIFDCNEGRNSILTGFTIKNGHAFGDSTDSGGGAIYCYQSSPTIIYCVISGNHAEKAGGGITCDKNSHALIEKCEISNNQSGKWGGGIFCYYSNPDIDSCIIKNNLTRDEGGGISFYSENNSKITNCCISGNVVTFRRGGGIAVRHGNPVMMNCEIVGNSASDIGGGIWLEASNSNIQNCTVYGNYGGGIYFSLGSLTLENSIVWCNNSVEIIIYSWSGVIIDSFDPNVGYYSYVNIAYNDIKYGKEGIYIFGYPEWLILDYGLGNLDADPCFINPGFWDPNGTPSNSDDDFLVTGDYHLKSQAGRWDPNTQSWVIDNVTSPCIDAGNPGCPLDSEPSDSNNLRINMGAFGGTPTASKTPYGWALLADLTNDGIVDCNDLSHQTDDWLQTGDCLFGDLDRNKIVNFSDIALLATDWLKQTLWHQP